MDATKRRIAVVTYAGVFMNKQRARLLTATVLALSAFTAHANVTYTFELTFGPTLLDGETRTGTFVIDSPPSPSGYSSYVPNGLPGGTVLAFDITIINGYPFTLADAGVVSIGFQDAVLTALNYIAACNDSGCLQINASNPSNLGGFVTDTGQGSNITSVAITSVVPEPATLALIGIGLAGIPFVRRRRTPA